MVDDKEKTEKKNNIALKGVRIEGERNLIGNDFKKWVNS